MNRAAIAIAVTLAAGPASADWIAQNSLAIANPGDPVLTGITFEEGDTCDSASLFILGNKDVRAISLVVDGTAYGTAEATLYGDVAMIVTAGPGALRAIKSGTQAAVITDQGSIYINLSGSAAAMNSAYAACMRNVRESVSEYLRPIQPSAREQDELVNF